MKTHFSVVVLVGMLLLPLTGCHRSDNKTVLRGVIQQGKRSDDFYEDNQVDENRINQINDEAAQSVSEQGEVSVPVVNNISNHDIDSARAHLRNAGKEAKEYGESRGIHSDF